jgi:hypothetical protein
VIDSASDLSLPSTSGGIVAHFQAGAVSSPAQVSLVEIPVEEFEGLREGEGDLLAAFEISAVDMRTQSSLSDFAQPVSIFVDYGESGLNPGGVAPDGLAIARLEPDNGNWFPVPSQIDDQSKTIAFTAEFPSTWALIDQSAGLPAQSAPAATATPDLGGASASASDINGSGTAATSQDGPVTVQLPAGSTADLVVVRVLDSKPQFRGGLLEGQDIALAFELELNSQPGDLGSFRSVGPVTVRVNYDEISAALADVEMDNLSLARFDIPTARWLPMDASVDSTSRVISANATEPGLWGLVSTVPETTGSSGMLWIWSVAALGVVSVTGFVGYRVLSRRQDDLA